MHSKMIKHVTQSCMHMSRGTFSISLSVSRRCLSAAGSSVSTKTAGVEERKQVEKAKKRLQKEYNSLQERASFMSDDELMYHYLGKNKEAFLDYKGIIERQSKEKVRKSPIAHIDFYNDHPNEISQFLRYVILR